MLYVQGMVGKAPADLAAGQAEWREQAIERWGARVAALEMTDWQTYVLSRNASPAPASPLELMQER
jgi:hypothetical protein